MNGDSGCERPAIGAESEADAKAITPTLDTRRDSQAVGDVKDWSDRIGSVNRKKTPLRKVAAITFFHDQQKEDGRIARLDQLLNHDPQYKGIWRRCMKEWEDYHMKAGTWS